MANLLFRKRIFKPFYMMPRKGLSDSEGHHTDLKRVLTVRDLTFFGIAAVIGTGVFTAMAQQFSWWTGQLFSFCIHSYCLQLRSFIVMPSCINRFRFQEVLTLTLMFLSGEIFA